ncbi:MAG: transcriptional regulator [Rhodococcus sp.]|nr:transcriptional regulator [Rhodococcus sp. (in: high G+C Gram-positive bacteria)]
MSDNLKRSRPALILVVAVGTIGCLALGWWQWERYESASGSGQNLGYALQWPLFAAFLVFAYRRFVQLEDQQAEDVSESPDEPAAKAATVREIPADLLPPRPQAPKAADEADTDLEAAQTAEYNTYLAELNARDPQRSS